MTAVEFIQSFHLAKSKIYTLFLEGRLSLNGIPCKRETLLKQGDCVVLEQVEDYGFIAEEGNLNIVYEDDYLLVVDKPAFMLVHTDGNTNTKTLCNYVAGYYQKKGYDIAVRFAHRLDYETTGLILFCKDWLTVSYIGNLIETHTLRRIYRFFVGGILSQKKGTLRFPIGEDRHHNLRKRVSQTGKSAITHYEVIEEFTDFSLISAQLGTGRTHQIRVHFSHIGHPLWGDELYYGNSSKIHRVALHSYEMEFVHPVLMKKMHFVCPLADDMQQILEREYAIWKARK